MTPLTVNPKVVIHIEMDSRQNPVIKAFGTNICPDLQIVMVDSAGAFEEDVRGVPFKEYLVMEANLPDIPA